MKYKKFVKRNCVDICIFIIVLVFIICVNLLITPPKQKNLGVGYAILRGDDNMINALGKALINSVKGQTEDGLIFCGSNVSRIKEIVSVKDLMKELVCKL